MKRRSFMQAFGGAVGSGALALRSLLRGEDPGAEKSAGESTAKTPEGPEIPLADQVPRRVLGRTGEKISIIGYPGLAMVNGTQEECNASVKAAFERGLNYFDVAPAYGNGEAERKLGIALEAIDRKGIFLSCKTRMREEDGARKEIERSLELLKTDRFDLYQLHALFTPEEVKKALGPGGAMEAVLEAQKEGKVRSIGFSAHTTKGALEAMRGFRFDTVMFPINFVEMFHMGFGKPVLDLAKEQGAAVIAIKGMSRGAWRSGEKRTRQWWYPSMEEQEDVNLAIRYTLSLEPVVATIPPAWLDLVEKAVVAGRAYRKASDADAEKLKGLAATCDSLFKGEEAKAAFRFERGRPCHEARV